MAVLRAAFGGRSRLVGLVNSCDNFPECFKKRLNAGVSEIGDGSDNPICSARLSHKAS